MHAEDRCASFASRSAEGLFPHSTALASTERYSGGSSSADSFMTCRISIGNSMTATTREATQAPLLARFDDPVAGQRLLDLRERPRWPPDARCRTGPSRLARVPKPGSHKPRRSLQLAVQLHRTLCMRVIHSGRASLQGRPGLRTHDHVKFILVLPQAPGRRAPVGSERWLGSGPPGPILFAPILRVAAQA